jgi:3-methyladenine DNA glycosylase AlkD
VVADPGGRAFVAAHRGEAAALGEALAGLIEQPEVFVTTLTAGLRRLVDPTYAEMIAVVSPGTTADYAVRAPLLEVVHRPLRRALREGSSSTALWLAQRVIATNHRDLRLFALPALRRALAEDPEQTWQLMRRLAGRAGDWVDVDSLADVWARGILAEPFRWAELEQLAFSRSVFERRLVGATLATIPHRVPTKLRAALGGASSERALGLVALLMGDAEALVQKALAWALREWTPVDPGGVARLLRHEAMLARASDDGSRAWVVRETFGRQPAELVAELRAILAGVRRHADAPSSSVAAAAAVRFGPLLSTVDHEVVARQGDRYARSRA